MMRDEIIDEVLAVRDAHAAQFGYDLRAIVADLRKTEALRIASGRTIVAPPVVAHMPNSGVQGNCTPQPVLATNT